MREFPRETDELFPLVATVRTGDVRTPVTELDYSVVKSYLRPTAWTAAPVVDGEPCFRINGPELGSGEYKVFARINSLPERPVIEVTRFRLT